MKEDCFITHERMIVPEIPSSKEEAVIPCMKCTFEDLTPEQIEQIQKPALDAAEVANSAAEAANTAAEAANDATQSANIAAEAANDAATEANNSATLANAAANKANQAAESIDDKISGKQDRLISGDNIEIKDNVISAQGINGKLFEDTSKTYQLYYFKNGLFNSSQPASTNLPFSIMTVSLPSSDTAEILPISSYGIVMSVWQLKYAFSGCVFLNDEISFSFEIISFNL